MQTRIHSNFEIKEGGSLLPLGEHHLQSLPMPQNWGLQEEGGLASVILSSTYMTSLNVIVFVFVQGRRSKNLFLFALFYSVFTCGRRPAGLLATHVVVVGGITFIHGYWESPCMVLKHDPLFSFNLKSPCMVLMFMYGLEGGSHPILTSKWEI